jgi:hypothetical protein
MAKNSSKERLTEMITLVVTPSMRAHLDHAAEARGNMPYAYPTREALGQYLDREDPLTADELKRITDNYLAGKTTRKSEDIT